MAITTSQNSTLKFGRNYSLTINISAGGLTIPITVGLPFTIEFDITRNTLTSANVCQIRLYNLSPANRNALRRSVTSGWSEPILDLVLRGGYGTNLPVIFSGNVSEAWSVREGINYITQLECYDGGFSFVNAVTGIQVTKGTPYKVIIQNLIASMGPYVSVGSVSNYPGTAPKNFTLNGNTTKLLDFYSGGGFFIDNGIGYALTNTDYSSLFGAPGTINASAGLYNAPIFQSGPNTVKFDMEFEPSLNIGKAINLISAQDTNFNGLYKITSVKHRGMISQTVCGEVTTTAEFFFLQSFTAVS